jgi:hypothetical protein
MPGGGPPKTKIILKDEMPIRGYSYHPINDIKGH